MYFCKTKKSRDKQKRACETVSVKRQVKQMEGNLEQLRYRLNALNVEYSNKTAELLARQKNIEVLTKQIFYMGVHLEDLNRQKNSGISAISNLTREINKQQHRIARKNLCLQVIIVVYYHMVITTNKADKRKAVPFSDELPPRANV